MTASSTLFREDSHQVTRHQVGVPRKAPSPIFAYVIRYFIRSASRHEGFRPAFVSCRAFFSGRMVSLEFRERACLLRGSSALCKPFLRSRDAAAIYPVDVEWPREGFFRSVSGRMPKCNKRIVVRIARGNSFTKWIVVLPFSDGCNVVAFPERALVIP